MLPEKLRFLSSSKSENILHYQRAICTWNIPKAIIFSISSSMITVQDQCQEIAL